MLTLTACVWLAVAAVPPTPGEVKLPLRDYVTLVERIEALEAARTEALARVEPTVAEVVAQRLSLTLGDDDVELSASFEVELRGGASQPVLLPLAGVASRVVVEPQGAAAVEKAEGGLRFLAPAAGHYRVSVQGKARLDEKAGVETLALAPMVAPVAELEVAMAAGRTWRCAGAVVSEDVVREERRILRLTLPRGQALTFETRRDVRVQEVPKAVATAVVVTAIGVGRDGLRRHDIALYEVARGELGALSVTLPAGVEPERVVTDEGEATPWVEGRSLRVDRTKKLTATGYLAIASSPSSRDTVALDGLAVECKVRARYLAVASDVAARFTPSPEASWTRVDLSDLPLPIREASRMLGLVAAWRLRGEEARGQVAIAALPSAPRLGAVVRQRQTLTLLTVEGTLLHRDKLSLDGDGSAFEVGLPADGTLWSAQVNGVGVRPIEREGRVLIPLGLASATSAEVEVVIVQQRAVKGGRSTLDLALPEVATPVLAHEWRLLLPERNRYRYLAGDLARSSESAPPSMTWSGAAAGRSRVAGAGGTAEISGVVTDAGGGSVPGARVELSEAATGRRLTVESDARGAFAFVSLPPGTYSLRCAMPGFRTADYSGLRLGPGQRRKYAIPLDVAALMETVTVQAAPQELGRAQRQRLEEAETDAAALEQVRDFRANAMVLQQGLVGGVKPVPVAIPEAGKVLVLAGVLPPSRVSVTLGVKAPRDSRR